MTRRASPSSARAHARHAFFCSCDKVVHGNGAKYQHRQRHLRAKDGHHYQTYEDWRADSPERQP
jgi:hypothetical protein